MFFRRRQIIGVISFTSIPDKLDISKFMEQALVYSPTDIFGQQLNVTFDPKDKHCRQAS
jgi:hypothetical protein